MLPTYIDENDLDKKEKMGRNMKDFVIMKQLNKNIKNAFDIAQFRKDEIL